MFNKYRRLSDTLHISTPEGAEILDFIRENRLVAWCKWEKRAKNQSTSTHAFVYIGDVNVTITIKGYKTKGVKTYQFRLDDERVVEETRAPGLMAELNKEYKMENIAKTGSKYLLAVLKYGLPGRNGGKKFGLKAYPRTKQDYHPELSMQRISDVYYYDENSMYPAIFADKIPDSTKRELCGDSRVKPGWIGFRIVNAQTWQLSQPGERAWFQMPLMESPYKKLIQKWYDKKQEAREKGDFITEARYKAKLNSVIGLLQYRNPFVWAYIILTARKQMDALVDENTILVHTDSIVSLKKREDLDVGTGIGQFREKHLESFVFNAKTENFQMNFDPPSIKGIPKSLYKKGWDMTKDTIPVKGIYPWKIDKDELKLVRNKEYENLN